MARGVTEVRVDFTSCRLNQHSKGNDVGCCISIFIAVQRNGGDKKRAILYGRLTSGRSVSLSFFSLSRLFFSLSLSFSFSLSLFSLLSLSFFFLSLSVSFCLSVCLSVFLFFSLSFFLSFFLSLFLSLFSFFSLFLFFSLSLSLSLSLFLFLSLVIQVFTKTPEWGHHSQKVRPSVGSELPRCPTGWLWYVD